MACSHFGNKSLFSMTLIFWPRLRHANIDAGADLFVMDDLREAKDGARKECWRPRRMESLKPRHSSDRCGVLAVQRMQLSESLAEDAFEFRVIPKCPVAAGVRVETRKDIVPGAKIGSDGACVVELVASRDQQYVLAYLAQVREVAFLPQAPWFLFSLRVRNAVCAGPYDLCNALAPVRANDLFMPGAAIFERIVE